MPPSFPPSQGRCRQPVLQVRQHVAEAGGPVRNEGLQGFRSNGIAEQGCEEGSCEKWETGSGVREWPAARSKRRGPLSGPAATRPTVRAPTTPAGRATTRAASTAARTSQMRREQPDLTLPRGIRGRSARRPEGEETERLRRTTAPGTVGRPSQQRQQIRPSPSCPPPLGRPTEAQGMPQRNPTGSRCPGNGRKWWFPR